jgi:hypothetical protein
MKPLSYENRMRALALTLLLIPSLSSAQAMPLQTEAAPVTPLGWAWRTDRPATPQRGGTGGVTDALFEFNHMAPGWHVTMGPGGALYDPALRAEGRFEVEGQMILFPEATTSEYGVFVGGTAMDGDGASWTAFVVRPDGTAGVIRRAAGVTSNLMPWSAHAAVAARDSTGFARNVVAVRAEPDSVRMFVNGTRVGAWARADLAVDGHFGLRIGQGVNIHVTNLDLKRRLAPFPSRR